MKWWLKVICVALLAYSAVFSFWHPMGAGGLEVSATKFHPGTNEFVFTGYGTHFLSEQPSLQVFVANDSTAVFKADIKEVISEAKVAVSVFLPDTLSSKRFEFFANTDRDGTVKVDSPVGSEGFVFVKGANSGLPKVSVKNNLSLSFNFPFQPIIIESIRNLMWHVPMWFTMFVVMTISFIFSLRVLSKKKKPGAIDTITTESDYDLKASSAAAVGLLFCTLGLMTGSVWARFAWGDWWTNDPQLNGAMVVFLMYVAYFILRKSVPDEEKRARLSGIFNIFAFVLMIILLMVMPRFAENSLHPGKGGNPAFSQYDLNSTMKTVFYPAALGFILLGYWLYNLTYRVKKLELANEENL